MKVLFIFRSGCESEYILSKIRRFGVKHFSIIETGEIAKKSKLKRTFSKSPLFWPRSVLDLASVWLYSYRYTNYFKKRVTAVKVPPIVQISDINSEACVEEIKKIHPDMIVIFGTAIVKDPFFKQVKVPIFNIHTGILPRYRNVHSEFWAYVNKDFKNIGVTIIHLNRGIDSGAIALQRRSAYRNGDGLFEMRVKNIKLIPKMIEELIRLQKQKKLPKIKQNNKDAHFYKTPGFFDLVRFTLAK